MDGVENPEQWIAEHELPPGSKYYVSEILNWVADLDEEMELLPLLQVLVEIWYLLMPKQTLVLKHSLTLLLDLET